MDIDVKRARGSLRRAVAWVGAVAVVVSGLVVMPQTVAQAANGANFDPGYIISDTNFYDARAMTEAEIQAFLVAKGSGLANLSFDVASRARSVSDATGNVRCEAFTGGTALPASRIIFRAQQACYISAKVLLVTLQKEQGLIARASATQAALDRAMGMACPDTAPCAPGTLGFGNQVYEGAKQLHSYKASRFGTQPGLQTRLWHPDAARCGSSTFVVQNHATAALYNYTPYRPNAAAISAYPGLGDSCSSYGNRNFWFQYSDWFGDPTFTTSLVRSPNSATIYFLANDHKYPIGLTAIYHALAPLGPLTIVSDRYLADIPTGNLMPRLVRDPGGSLYYFDVGYKLPFATCDLVADYGQSCSNWVQLSQAQADLLPTGPPMTETLGTTSGKRFVMVDGVKHEAQDLVTLQQGGYSTNYNVILESSIDPLPLGAPLTRDLTFVRNRQTNAITYISGGVAYEVTSQQAANFGISARTDGILDSASLEKLGLPGQTFSGIVTAPGGQLYALSGDGKSAWNQAAPAGVSTPGVSQQFIDSFPTLEPIGDGSMVKTANNGTIYILQGGVLRPITYWADVVALSSANSPMLITLADAVIHSLSKGPLVQRIGSLVRIDGHGTVYLVEGLTSMVPVGTYEVTDQFGRSRSTAVLPAEALADYTATPHVMGYGVECAGTKYVAMGGSLHAVNGLEPLYPLGFPAMSAALCSQTPVGHDAGHFISTPDGTIWLLEAGQRRPIAAWAKFLELHQSLGTSSMGVSWDFARRIPEGSLITQN